MNQSFRPNDGWAWWSRLILYAGAAFSGVLLAASSAGAYCVYVPNVEAQSISLIDTGTNSTPAPGDNLLRRGTRRRRLLEWLASGSVDT